MLFPLANVLKDLIERYPMFKPIFSLLLFTLLSMNVFAGTPYVEGGLFGSCNYFSTVNGSFTISYENKDLPWGTKIEIHYGLGSSFESSMGGHHWINPQTVEAFAVAPYVWQSSLKRITTGSRGSFSSNQLRFIIVITLPDGRVVYDRGSYSSNGYYAANFGHTRLACSEDEMSSVELTVQSISAE